MPNTSSCPGRDLLRQLVLGQLSGADLDELDAHLAACADCAAHVEKMAEGENKRDAPPTLSLSSSASPPPAVAPNPVVKAPAEALPAQIGRYRVEKLLGKGGFGRVYLARDQQLDRTVAVKVPHPHLAADPQTVKAYLAEARIVANLDHPHIVPVYDSGATQDFPLYMVSRYIDGHTLAQNMAQNLMDVAAIASLAASVAEALHYAHRQGLVHRDVKPSNILLERLPSPPLGGEGMGVRGFFKPYVADFGLALKEEAFGTGPTHAGTPAYMSPEQARGEGHRVDGRSDIFSLGVVFYELLTGRRPFPGSSTLELLEQIANLEPRPPRQIKDGIARELERICLKALAKKASDRYTTAQDMADDLRHWLASRRVEPGGAGPAGGAQPRRSPDSPRAVGGSPEPATSSTEGLPRTQGPTTPSDQRPIKIVPKGLRSFDAHDADFFLELLPGPRDRDGLPESIRFWKKRVEETDPEQTFAVGLIYGPSGSGKSSLVKAGLLPRLVEHVVPVYLEATGNDTEARLLSRLRKVLPELSTKLTLKDTIAALRRGVGFQPAMAGATPKQKALIVLDQFEQWLHANEPSTAALLVEALRQCDGEHVQCLVLVRDDFWMAATRFMAELEIELAPGHNTAAIDLFDLPHARRVLTAFGRAFQALPEHPAELECAQKAFIEETVAAVAEDQRVICVRLALFAEMVKGRPWTPATLKEVGGAQGVGVAFLEDTFSSAAANPKHRLHQQGARAVLKALLPESGSDIKGHMRSREQLLAASGYGARTKDFETLLHMLDAELRLITPTEPEGAETEQRAAGLSPAVRPDPAESAVPPGGAQPGGAQPGGAQPGGAQPRRSLYYQLTHDYLVHSLRDWLTRKQRETRRGRAELRLAERAAAWNAKPEKRHLPAWWEWLNIRLFTRKKNWTGPQRKMMRKAGRYHFVRGIALALLLAVLSLGGYEAYGRLQAHHLHGRLLEAKTEDVEGIVTEMAPFRRWLDPLLQSHFQADSTTDARKKLHASLALLPTDSGQGEYLLGRLLDGGPLEVVVIRSALLEHKAQWTGPLWNLLADSAKDLNLRFRAACALALFDPQNARWDEFSKDVAAKLITQEPLLVGQWTEALGPAGKWLLPHLASFFADDKRNLGHLALTAKVYGRFASDHPEAFGELEKRLSEVAAADASDDAQITLAKRQANVAAALLVMGRDEMVWPLLKHDVAALASRPPEASRRVEPGGVGPAGGAQPRRSQDPTRRSYLMERLAPGGVEAKVLLSQLDSNRDVSIKRAILLALGEYGIDQLPQVERDNLLPRLLELYFRDPDSGIHGASEWLVRKWGAADKLHGLRPIEEVMRTGKPQGGAQWYLNSQGQTMVMIPAPGKVWLGDGPERKLHRISAPFAIASKEVTVAQFLRFREEFRYEKQYSPTSDCPINSVTWYEAAHYCNWLSKEEEIPEQQWCYLPNQAGKYDAGMQIAPRHEERTGYRLPTEAEWEFACRSGSTSAFSFGQDESLLGKYAWYVGSSGSKNQPAGLLKPNDFGLFDMHGNAWEWTESRGDGKSVAKYGETISGKNDSRVLRGGAFNYDPLVLRSSCRSRSGPANRRLFIGFRPARTLPF